MSKDKDRLVLGGRFRLVRHLGGGGMAEVYLAEQLSLGRQVALKVLKRDLSSQPAMSERFRREAKLLSTVEHPSVVRVIDFETNPRDGTVLVLELADGQTLEQTLKAGPWEPRRAIRVLLQLAEGLAAVHARGIIHRDLKPQNVVIGEGTTGEQARLLDFGIARLMELDDGPAKLPMVEGADPFMSLPGQAVGTPAYVAPEQARAEPVSPRTDVYAFGVVAFRMLAGRLPFEGPEARDYLEQHVHAKPPPLETIAPHVAPFPALSKLVMQCLEKNADARPKDGAALVDALRAVLPPDQLALSTQTRLVLSAVSTQTLSAVKGTAVTVGERSAAFVRTSSRLVRRLDRQFKQSLAVTAVITLLTVVAFALWPRPAVERAKEELATGHAAEALATIDAALAEAKGDVPTLLSLKVGALHALQREEDSRAMLREAPYQVLFPATDAVLGALAEDFGAQEGDDEVLGWLSMVPLTAGEATLRRFANGPASLRQWGALRFLDVSQRTQGLEVPKLYAASLRAESCVVRAVAATRLGALGDDDAIGALRELSESAKSTSINCGQDEAAEAIRVLKSH